MKKYLFFKQQLEEFQEIKETIKVVEKAAASYIRVLQRQVEILHDYKNSLELILGRVIQFKKNRGDHPLLQTRHDGKRVLLLITGNKGIVGKMYHDLVRKAVANKDYYQEVWVLGEKGKTYLQEEGVQPSKQLFFSDGGVPDAKNLEAMGAELIDFFRREKWKSLDILYPYYVSLEDQQPTVVQFLPFDFAKMMTDLQNNNLFNLQPPEGFPLFEPDAKTVLDILIKQWVNIFFIQVVFEAKLSEFSARTLTAQDVLSRTDEVIKKVHLDFLKERKKSLTQKQLESFNAHKITCSRDIRL